MITIEEKIAVMQHFADGGKIERRPAGFGWSDEVSPVWDWHRSDYRIKPEPRSGWLRVLSDGTLAGFSCTKIEAENASRIGYKFIEFVEKLP